MHLGGARGAQHPNHGTCRGPPDDRVVHHHEALALGAVTQRVQLHADGGRTQCLRRGDERAAYVPVLDQPLAVGDPAGPGVALGGRHTGLRHTHHQVGLDWGLGRQHLAHSHPGMVDALPVQDGVRTGKVDELEQAQPGVHDIVVEGSNRATAALVDHHYLARLQLSDHLGADHVQGRRLRCQDPAALQAPEAEGPEAVRIAYPDDPLVVGQHQGEGPPQARQNLDQCLVEGLTGIHPAPRCQLRGQ